MSGAVTMTIEILTATMALNMFTLGAVLVNTREIFQMKGILSNHLSGVCPGCRKKIHH